MARSPHGVTCTCWHPGRMMPGRGRLFSDSLPRWQCLSRERLPLSARRVCLHLAACRRRRRGHRHSSSGGLAAPLCLGSPSSFLRCRRRLRNVRLLSGFILCSALCVACGSRAPPKPAPLTRCPVRNVAAVEHPPSAPPRRPGASSRPRVESGASTDVPSSQTTVRSVLPTRQAENHLRQPVHPPAPGGVASQQQPARGPGAETRGGGRPRTAQRSRPDTASVSQTAATRPAAPQPAQPVRRFVRCGGGGAVKLMVADTPQPVSRRWRS